MGMEWAEGSGHCSGAWVNHTVVVRSVPASKARLEDNKVGSEWGVH